MAVSRNAAEAAVGPVDVEHLRAVTFGDPKVEREVLSLFGSQASAALIAIEQAAGRQERSDAAHRLVGAARAIGASELADAADEVERADALTADHVAALASAMAAVISFLEARLAPAPRQSDAG